MNFDDPEVVSVLRRSMIARIATLSRTGRPGINPLYIIDLNVRRKLSGGKPGDFRLPKRLAVFYQKVDQAETD